MKLKIVLLIIIGTVIFSSCEKKTLKEVKLNNEIDTLSYAIGADLGIRIKTANFEELNYDAIFTGLMNAIDEKELALKEEELVPYIKNYINKIRIQLAEKNLEEGKAFLEENKKKEGVITTESGLQYEIIAEGTGKTPGPKDMVKCNYEGTLLDGTVFDGTKDKGKPAEFSLARVIKGWTEGLQLMKEGAKYKFYIPSDLAYGQRGGGKIEPNSVLIFEIELLEVNEAMEPVKQQR